MRINSKKNTIKKSIRKREIRERSQKPSKGLVLSNRFAQSEESLGNAFRLLLIFL